MKRKYAFFFHRLISVLSRSSASGLPLRRIETKSKNDQKICKNEKNKIKLYLKIVFYVSFSKSLFSNHLFIPFYIFILLHSLYLHTFLEAPPDKLVEASCESMDWKMVL
jgi:hypothetical protein